MDAAHQGEEQPELRSEGLHWKSYPDKTKQIIPTLRTYVLDPCRTILSG